VTDERNLAEKMKGEFDSLTVAKGLN
jgi:hypothetical protein